MTKRFVLVVFSALVFAPHASMAELTVLGIRAKMVDCYADPDLKEEKKPHIEEKDWPPGPLPVEGESEDGVRLTLNGRQCWFDRSQLKLDVPSSKECPTSDQYGSRGWGDKDCPKPKNPRGR